MRPSPAVKTLTVIVLVLALIYFLFPIYWAIIASTKTPSQMTSGNGLWFSVSLDQIPKPWPPTTPSCSAGPVATSGAGC